MYVHIPAATEEGDIHTFSMRTLLLVIEHTGGRCICLVHSFHLSCLLWLSHFEYEGILPVFLLLGARYSFERWCTPVSLSRAAVFRYRCWMPPPPPITRAAHIQHSSDKDCFQGSVTSSLLFLFHFLPSFIFSSPSIETAGHPRAGPLAPRAPPHRSTLRRKCLFSSPSRHTLSAFSQLLYKHIHPSVAHIHLAPPEGAGRLLTPLERFHRLSPSTTGQMEPISGMSFCLPVTFNHQCSTVKTVVCASTEPMQPR